MKHFLGGFWAVGDGERYLCLEQDVYRNLHEQVEYLQCETQAVIKCDALILCQGTDSGPYLASHVIEGSFHFRKEGGQSLVVVELVVIHHFMHLLPRGVSLRAKVAGSGLTFCLGDSVP